MRPTFRHVLTAALIVLLAPASRSQAAPALDPDLVGVWENAGEDLEMVFLPDGRTFSLNTMAGNKVEGEPGTWQIKNHKLVIDWLISGVEREDYGVTGDSLTLGGWLNLGRVGDAGDAANEYTKRMGQFAAIARKWAGQYPVGPARATNAKDDPHPERAPRNVTVYTGAGLDFEDLTILTGSYKDPYQQVHEYQVGQAVEFFLFPNGRFWHQSWIPKGLDANFQPIHELTRVWGSYSVKPGGPVDGDAVTLKFDGGDTQTVKVLGGRRFLKSPNVLYFNQNPKPNAGEERQFQ
ncbi:hypothetical protein [Deinococcus apachensis]|uniref:hypothetical protein n=1 Tax=Deinococcus apachensis TaxID=309886 RepID=UPI00037D0C8E|nr:hypothetical protein [Deinococcus apachensis]